MTDDNTNNWRDLVGEMTAEQVAKLERAERDGDEWTPASLLDYARSMTRGNVAQVMHADIALPADAVEGRDDPWDFIGSGYARQFRSTQYNNGDVEVIGVQFDDGRVQRHVLVRECDDLSPTLARQLAAAVVEAAELVERLGGTG